MAHDAAAGRLRSLPGGDVHRQKRIAAPGRRPYAKSSRAAFVASVSRSAPIAWRTTPVTASVCRPSNPACASAFAAASASKAIPFVARPAGVRWRKRREACFERTPEQASACPSSGHTTPTRVRVMHCGLGSDEVDCPLATHDRGDAIRGRQFQKHDIVGMREIAAPAPSRYPAPSMGLVSPDSSVSATCGCAGSTASCLRGRAGGRKRRIGRTRTGAAATGHSLPRTALRSRVKKSDGSRYDGRGAE